MSKKRAASKKHQSRYILEALENEYGVPAPDPGRVRKPLDELVLTILSQNTNDVNRDRAYGSLRKKYPTWEKVARADQRSIESAIRVGGLAGQKSRRIKQILKWVKDTFGDYSLEDLKKMESGRAYDTLIALKGVGPKTASIVMLFTLGRPYFPVDTHILRVTTRLGLIRSGTDAARAHVLLGEMFPTEKYYSAHLNIITHGRRICSARNPNCPACVLFKRCEWPDKKA